MRIGDIKFLACPQCGLDPKSRWDRETKEVVIGCDSCGVHIRSSSLMGALDDSWSLAWNQLVAKRKQDGSADAAS